MGVMLVVGVEVGWGSELVSRADGILLESRALFNLEAGVAPPFRSSFAPIPLTTSLRPY